MSCSNKVRSKRFGRLDEGGVRLCQRPNLQVNPLPDGCVVYQRDKSLVHFLNQTAAQILGLCDGHHSPQRIETRVAEHFSVRQPGHNLTGDILQRFIAAGLVVVEARSPTVTTCAQADNRRKK